MITKFKIFENLHSVIVKDYSFINDINVKYWKYTKNTRKKENILTPFEFYEKYNSDEIINAYNFIKKNISMTSTVEWVRDYYTKVILFLEQIPDLEILRKIDEYDI